MDLGIKDKVAIVIGGTLGIGLGCSIALSQEGTKVFMVSRNQDNINNAIAKIENMGGTAAGFSADCLTEEGIKNALNACREKYGNPDIVVYVPFVTIFSRLEDVTMEQFAQGDNALIVRFMQVINEVIPHMKEQKWGRILTIGSMAVRQIHRYVPHIVPNTYRLAAVGLCKTISDEVGKYGINVNTIATGGFMNENFETTFRMLAEKNNQSYDELMAEKTASIPVGRYGRVDEIGAVCTFLCSDKASYVTGTTILVDGGKTEVPL